MTETLLQTGNVGVTGHRPGDLGITDKTLDPFSDRVLNMLTRVAIEELQVMNPTRVWAGAAQGWDTACAIAALSLNIPLTIVIPFSSMYTKWQKDRVYFKWLKVLTKAEDVIILHHGMPLGDTPEAAKKCASAWLQERNEYIVDRCPKILSLHSGKTRGGTANCLRYAAKMGRTVRGAWPAWVKFLNAYNGTYAVQ